jgi:uncharacterized protein
METVTPSNTGVEQDYKHALACFHSAADKRHIRAQCMLGGMYVDGTGTSICYDEAYECYHAAALQADPYAEFALGKM